MLSENEVPRAEAVSRESHEVGNERRSGTSGSARRRGFRVGAREGSSTMRSFRQYSGTGGAASIGTVRYNMPDLGQNSWREAHLILHPQRRQAPEKLFGSWARLTVLDE